MKVKDDREIKKRTRGYEPGFARRSQRASYLEFDDGEGGNG